MKKTIIAFAFAVVLLLALPALPFSIQSQNPELPQIAKEKIPAVSDSDEAALPKPSAAIHTPANLQYKVLDKESGSILTLSPTDYLIGVVAAEMPASFEAEALKAQAVAAHTNALRQMQQELENPTPALQGAYLTTDPQTHQAYQSNAQLQAVYGDDYEQYYAKISAAVKEVADQILTYEEQPIIAAFCSISNGKTEQPENVWNCSVPYLKTVESPFDRLSSACQSTVTRTKKEVQARLEQAYDKISLPNPPDDWFSIVERTRANQVKLIKVGENIELSGQEFRRLMGLKSADFTIQYQEGKFIFTVYGAGHGVGMSQYGADYLAKQGKTYAQILEFYYKGAKLESIPI